MSSTDSPDPESFPDAENPAEALGAANPEVEQAKKEAAAAQDRFLRTAADFENFKRRALREKEELRLFSKSGVLEDLLPVWDNLALALVAARQPNAEVKTLVGGVEMVLQQFKAALAGHGLTEINPLGKPFDAHQQEALSHQPSKEVPEESVLTVVRPGFMLNGRLLRPASVIISSGPAKS
jgi:molecular chaperone GrpE